MGLIIQVSLVNVLIFGKLSKKKETMITKCELKPGTQT